MAEIVAYVKILRGEVFAKRADGSSRQLKLGEPVYANEFISTGKDGYIELAMGNESPFTIPPGEQVLVSTDMRAPANHPEPAGADEAKLASGAELDTILQKIQAGADPTLLLEATAAGGSSGGGHDFVRLLRISEQLPPAELDHSINAAPEHEIPFAAGAEDENIAPVVPQQDISTDEDTPFSGRIVATDADGDQLEYALETRPEHGVVVVSINGVYTYVPNPNYHGSDSFVVNVSDGRGGLTAITVNVTVNSINDVPVAADQTLPTTEDTAVTGTIVATDADGDTLTYTLSTAAANGTVTLNADGSYSYQPNANFNGSDSFVVTVSDGNGGTKDVTVTVNVGAVNDAPVAADQTIATNEDTTVTGAIVASDVDGDALTYELSTAATNGTVTLNADGSYSYQPNANFNGSDSFVVTVSDGNGGTKDVTVTVNVGAVNDAPVATDQTISTDEDTTVTGAIVATDADGDTLTYALSTAAANGTVTLNADGSYSYQPNTDFNGSDSFIVTVSDGHGGTKDVTVTVNVGAVNDIPVAADQTISTDEDTTVTGAIVATDVDGDSLTYSLSAAATNGTVTLNADGSYSYQPNADFNGSDSFVVTVSDGNGGTRDVTVTVNVGAVNDAPVAADQMVSTDEDTTVTGAIVATDVDGDSLTYSLSTAAANGTVTLNADGSYSYQPNADFNGSDSFVVTVSDGHGGTKDVTVTVNVDAVNDIPVAADQAISTDEDTAVTGAIVATDVDGDTLSYALSTAAGNGTVTLNADGSYSYQPNANFNGTDSFVVTVSDGNGGTKDVTVTVNVGAVNDAPVAADQTISTNEDTTVTGAIVATDVDGDSLTYSLSTAASNGTVTLNADGSYSYQPNANFNGTDSFVVTVSDGNGGTKDVTVTVNVGAVNDAPVAADQTISTNEDTTVTGAIVATDIDGDTLTYSLSTAASNGTVTLNADGSYSYQPNADFNGSDSFVVTVSDGNGGTKDVTVTVNVAAVNDIPVAADQTINTDEDTSVTGAIVATDVDGDSLTYSLNTAATNGTVTLNADGSYSYQPNADFNGSDSFVVTVSDGNGGAKDVTITVNVAPVNDAPVGVDLNVSTDEDNMLAGNLSASDAENDPLSYALASSPSNGSVVVNADGSYVFTPNSNFNGSDSFTVTVSDGNGGSDTITVNVTVNPVADAAQIAGTDTGALAEDAGVNVATGTLTISDVDGPAEEAFNPQTVTNTFGTFTLNSTGSWTFTLDNSSADVQGLAQGENSVQTFTVTSVDGTSHAVTITVTGINDAAVIGGSSSGVVTEDSQLSATGTLTISDVDGSSEESFSAGSYTGSFGNLVLDASGNWSYTLTANSTLAVQALDDGESLTDSITVTSADGTSHVISITINGANDAPVATAVALSDVAEDGSLTITAADLLAGASDVDGEVLTITAVSLATGNGSLIDNGDGTWTFTPAANFNGAVSFNYTVFDGTASTSSTASLNVTAVNDAPVAADQIVSTDEDIAVTGAIIASDVDGDSLTYSLNTSAANGTVTLNADGSYSYQPNANFNGSDSFVVTVSDGQGGTKDVTVTINVGAVNDIPVATDQTLSTDEDTVATGAIIATDVDGDTLSYTLSTAASNGTVTLNADGSYSYQPNADFNGSDSFVVTVSDGHGGTKDVTVTVNVGAVNDIPVAADQAISTDEDTAVTGAIVATDVDGDSLTYSLNTAATNGTVVLNADGSYSYQPNANFNGTDSFVVTVSDGNGGTKDVTVTVNVAAINDIPVAADQAISADEDTTVTGAIIASDADGDTLVYSLNTAAANGTVTLNADGSYSYQPNANFNGSDSFVVTVSDGHGGSKDVTVAINVAAVNDAPVGTDVSISTDEDTVINGTLLAADTENDALSFAVATGPAHGSVTVNADGSYAFTPNANFNGSDSFTVTVSDGHGGTDTITVNVTVNPINDAPTAAAVNLGAVLEDSGAFTITASDLLAGASDVDGNPLTVTALSLAGGSSAGTLVNNGNGTWTFTPSANFNGNVAFNYTVSDGSAAASSTAALTVTSVNDAPGFTGLATSVTYTESSTATITRRIIDSTVVVSAGDSPNFDGGSLTVNITNAVADQDLLGISNQGTGVHQISVSGSNVLYNFGSGAVIIGSFTGGSGGAPLVVTFNAAATAEAVDALVQRINYGNSSQLPDTTARIITFALNDGDGTANSGHDTTTRTVTVNVVSTNDTPVFSNLSGTRTHVEGGAAVVLDSNATVSDRELAINNNYGGSTLTLSRNGGANASDVFSGTGTLSLSGGNVVLAGVTIGHYDTAAYSNGQLVITFADGVTNAQVNSVLQHLAYSNSSDNPPASVTIGFVFSDGNTGAQGAGGARTTTRTIRVNITGVNDAPVGVDQNVSTDEDTAVNGSVTATDPENNPLTFALGTAPSHGSVVVNADGSYIYSPSSNFNGSDSFVVVVNDGHGGTDTITVNVTVNAVSDAAQIAGTDTGALTEDAGVNIASGTLTISDVDSPAEAAFNPQTVTNAFGTFTLDSAGNWTFTLDNGSAAVQSLAAGENSLQTFTITSVDGTTHTVTVTVSGSNDAAVITGSSSGTVSEDTQLTASGMLMISDVDDTGEAAFVAGTASGSFGSLVIDASGNWNYTLTANSTLAVQALDDGESLTDSITVTSADGTSHVISITINGANDAPVATAVALSDVAEDGSLTITAADLLAGASDVDGEALTITAVSLSTGNGSLIDNGDGTWTFTPAANFNGAVSFNYTVSDGTASTSSTASLNVTAAADAAQIAGTDTGALTEDAGVNIATGTLTISDVDSPAEAAFNPQTVTNAFGTFTLDSAGNWTFTLDNGSAAVQGLAAGENSLQTFTITSVDGTTHTVTVTVSGSNDAAVITGSSSGTVSEDAQLTASGMLMISDVDDTGEAAFVAGTASGSFGSLVIDASGNWSYTLTANSTLAVQALDDGESLTDSITVTSADGTGHVISITINGANDAPVATAVVLSDVAEDGSLTITAADLLAGASDVDGEALTITAVSLATGNGSLIDNGDGTWTFTPAANFNGAVSFNYTVSDGTASTSSTASLNVTAVNDAPVAADDTASTAEDNSITINVLANDSDVDGSGTLSVTLASASHGTVVINSDNTLSYTPNANFSGNDTITYVINDGNGGNSTATVTVTINPVADAPTLSVNAQPTIETTNLQEISFGGSWTGNADVSALTGGVWHTDNPGGLIEVGQEGTYLGNGVSNNSVIELERNSGDAGNLYTNVNVSAGATYVVEFDYSARAGASNNSVINVYWGGVLVATLNSGVVGWQHVVLNLPAASDGSTRLEFDSPDGGSQGGLLDNIQIVETRNAGLEDHAIRLGNIAANLTDTDGSESLAVVIGNLPDGAVLSDGVHSFTAGAGSNSADITGWNMNALQVTPPSNFNGNLNLTVTATSTETANGDSASTSANLTVVVTPVNDAPVGSAQSASGDEDSNISGTLTASDVDGDSLSFSLATGPSHGSVIVNSNGSYVFTPNANFNGSDSFTVTVADGHGGTNNFTVNVTVNPVNDAPNAANQALTTNEDTSIAGAIVASDVDGDLLSYTLTGSAAHGSVTLNADGSYSYAPASNFSGNDSFVVTVSDGHGGSKPVTVNVTINSVVDTPSLTIPSTVFSLVPGTAQISTTAAQSQTQLESALGLSAGTLDGFNPPGSDPGTVDVIDGQLTNYVYSLSSGNTASFNWRFSNGETSQSDINSGYNDLAILIITAPDGSRQSVLISSSEQAGPGTAPTGTYNFTASQTGTYQFSWLVLNGGDNGYDSTLNITDVNFISAGNNYGAPVALSLYAALGDTDGSESLQVQISGVPTGALFNAGTNLGGGVWSFTAAQLASLYLLPPDNFTGDLNLHVTATATDVATGTSSAVSHDMTVTIAATSNNVLGTAGNDSLTGTNSSDLISGFTGNDTLSGGNGNDLIYGGDGNDNLNGDNGHDSLFGQAGNDSLSGGTGNDLLAGGTGSDSLTGGTGADVFVWQLGDQGSGTAPVDTVTDFNQGQGDVLDLSSLLQGETQGTLSQYLHFSTDGSGNTRIEVWTDGNHSHSANQIIDLTGVDLTAGGTLTDTDIINQMLQQGRLRVDGGP